MKQIATLFSAFTAASLLTACGAGTPDVTFDGPPADAAVSSHSMSSVAPEVSSTAFTETASSAPASAPGSVKINVPFATQAPLANWDPLHEEACEEMSLILVKHYLQGSDVTPQSAEAELQELVKWETDVGYSEDVTAAEIAKIAKDKYGLNGRVLEDVTIADIKAELAKGNPVIVPAAGQKLGNPYFSGDGPPYHMFVITGYDDDEFITNDVGTKRGKDYRYDQDILFAAIHDWTGDKATIEQGAKTVVVITK